MKISYCTTCQNRLWQLEQTVPHNLKFIKRGVSELLILFYNDEESADKFSEKYGREIDEGRIRIIRIVEDRIFKDGTRWSYGITKDYVHSAALGEVLFNLDADNFIDATLHKTLLRLKRNEMVITKQKEWLPDGRSGRIGLCKSMYGILTYKDNGCRDDLEMMNDAVKERLRMRELRCEIEPISNLRPEEEGEV